MDAIEYKAKRQEIIRVYTEAIEKYERAGCFVDADCCYEDMHFELEELTKEYELGKAN